jgi:hypothetical protein
MSAKLHCIKQYSAELRISWSDYSAQETEYPCSLTSRAAHYCTMRQNLLVRRKRLMCYLLQALTSMFMRRIAGASNVGAVENFWGIGADDDLCEFDGDGRTAVQLAARCGRREAVDVLSAYSGTGDWGLEEEERVKIGGRLGECEGRRWWAWCSAFFVVCIVLLAHRSLSSMC